LRATFIDRLFCSIHKKNYSSSDFVRVHASVVVVHLRRKFSSFFSFSFINLDKPQWKRFLEMQTIRNVHSFVAGLVKLPSTQCMYTHQEMCMNKRAHSRRRRRRSSLMLILFTFLISSRGASYLPTLISRVSISGFLKSLA
jgi:hypothetical protein